MMVQAPVPRRSSGGIFSRCAASGVTRVMVPAASQMTMPSFTVLMTVREMLSNRWASRAAWLYFDSVSTNCAL